MMIVAPPIRRPLVGLGLLVAGALFVLLSITHPIATPHHELRVIKMTTDANSTTTFHL